MQGGFPDFSEDLLKELDKQFPEQSPDLKDSDRMVWFKAGQRSVVQHLLERKRLADESKLPQGD